MRRFLLAMAVLLCAGTARADRYLTVWSPYGYTTGYFQNGTGFTYTPGWGFNQYIRSGNQTTIFVNPGYYEPLPRYRSPLFRSPWGF